MIIVYAWLTFMALLILYGTGFYWFNNYGFNVYVRDIHEPWRESITRRDITACEFYASEATRHGKWWQPWNPIRWFQWRRKFGIRVDSRPLTNAEAEGMYNGAAAQVVTARHNEKS